MFLKIANRLSLTPNSGLGYAYEILYDFEQSRPSLQQVAYHKAIFQDLSNWAKIKSIDETTTYLSSDRKRNYYEKDAMCYPNILHEANWQQRPRMQMVYNKKSNQIEHKIARQKEGPENSCV